MKKLIITGASGMLGHTLCAVASEKWNVFAVWNSNKINISSVKSYKCDITNFKDFKKLFYKIKPDALIHLAANSQPNYCEEYPIESEIMNVDVSTSIAHLCKINNVKCLYTSTDLVFDGTSSLYSENDFPKPIMVYGKQKLKAEKYMRAKNNNVTICRMPLMFGKPSVNGKGNFMTTIVNSLAQQKHITLFSDEFRTPVGTISASKGLLLALDYPKETFHLGGKERLSRFDFGILTAKTLGYDTNLVTANLQSDLKKGAKRPADVSLNSQKAYSIGYNPMSISEELSVIYNS